MVNRLRARFGTPCRSLCRPPPLNLEYRLVASSPPPQVFADGTGGALRQEAPDEVQNILAVRAKDAACPGAIFVYTEGCDAGWPPTSISSMVRRIVFPAFLG